MNTLASLAAALAACSGASEPQYPSVAALQRAAASRGVACVRFRRVAPMSSLERQEGRCRSYAVATFRTAARQAAWLRSRLTEPWFPARYVVQGDRWVVWVWRREVAIGLREALRGRLARVSLRPPAARSLNRCRAAPRSRACTSPAPARPVPGSPDGPVYSYPAEVADVESTMVDGGLLVVTPAAPGTTAVTGALLDNRPGRAGEVAGALVVLESAAGAPVRAVTVSDARGAFAFMDVPVPPGGACLRITVQGGGGIGWFEYVDVFDPLAYFATWELAAEPHAYEDGRCSA